MPVDTIYLYVYIEALFSDKYFYLLMYMTACTIVVVLVKNEELFIFP